MKSTKTTNKDLPEELERRDAEKYSPIIVKARMNTYHDYKSKHVCGKMALLSDLDFYPELSDIKTDVMNGVYDEHADFEDCISMRADILEGEPESIHNIPLLKELALTKDQLKVRFPDEAADFFK